MIKDLFSGIGVVIDDQINENPENSSEIQEIVQSLENEGYPLIKYDALPQSKNLPHLHSVSFILLDWKLVGEGVPHTEQMVSENIEFIKELKKYSWFPIFVFSNESKDAIERKLKDEKVFSEDHPTHVFVKSKKEVDTCEKLFNELEKWVKNNPPVYILKLWEQAKREAKVKMLWDFYDAHKKWPKILYKAIKDDGGDIGELIQFLQKNLTSRVLPPTDICLEILEEVDETCSQTRPEDLRRLIECERFFVYPRNEDSMDKTYPLVGDVYKGLPDCNEEEYFLNIRPTCDIIRNKGDIYLLKGTVLDESTINSSGEDGVTFKKGELRGKKFEDYVAFIEGNVVRFDFRKLKIKKWKEIKTYRIGRLLPPYITSVQQRYSFYLQREGLPALPAEVFPSVAM